MSWFEIRDVRFWVFGWRGLEPGWRLLWSLGGSPFGDGLEAFVMGPDGQTVLDMAWKTKISILKLSESRGVYAKHAWKTPEPGSPYLYLGSNHQRRQEAKQPGQPPNSQPSSIQAQSNPKQIPKTKQVGKSPSVSAPPSEIATSDLGIPRPRTKSFLLLQQQQQHFSGSATSLGRAGGWEVGGPRRWRRESWAPRR